MAKEIVTAALAAAEAETTSLRDAALAHLAVWSEQKINPALLTVVEADTDLRVVVVTDGSVHIAVDAEQNVHLVDGKVGDWTRKGGPFANLAELGVVLDG